MKAAGYKVIFAALHRSLDGRGYPVLSGRLLDSTLLNQFFGILVRPMSERSPFIRRGVLDVSVHLESFMSFRQMFCDRRTAFIGEQESMAILPDLELPTRACPFTRFRGFFFTLREKLARTHRTPYFLNVPCKSFDENVCNV